MTELHEALADLARDHGHALFHDADAFRGALDDYLDEGAASMGTINLLTDAVRLGALDGLLSMLGSGASVESAVDTAGRRLARDRGSSDVAGAQWALGVLGYALGRVPASYATRLRPDALTAEPPAPPAPPAPQAPQTPPAQQAPPPTSPPSAPQWPGSGGAQGGAPGQPAPGQYGGWAPPGGHSAPRKRRTGLVIGLVAVAVLVIVGLVVGLVALTGDDEPSAGDDPSSETTSASESTSPTQSESASVDPALAVQGDGYTYQLPSDDWTDVTSSLADDVATVDTVTAWGNDLETARGNILVESSSAFGETDPAVLEADWKKVLSQSTGGTPQDIEDITIGGVPAVGVELEWTNANDFDVRQVAYLAVSGDQQYSITASFAQGDDAFEDVYREVLATWSWEG